jgi:uncharacterized membrane protein YdjX (TVP38/TMEM64 family)
MKALAPWRATVSVIWLAAGLALLLWLFSAGGEHSAQIAKTHPLLGLFVGYGLVVISQIVAPLSGFAIVVGMAKIYGLPAAMGMLYLSYLTTFASNFFLARRFGRPLVLGIIGRTRLSKLSALTASPRPLYVILSRVLGYYYNDAISYIWGVTDIGFSRYYAVSIGATVIPAAIEYAIVSQISLESPKGLLLFYLSLFALSGVSLIGWLLVHRFRSALKL